MKKSIRSRAYQDSDARLINSLYKRVTRRERSEAEFFWQWRQAPAGPGFIYLIEYQETGHQEPVLIGHHGIMPIRFSRGSDTLIAGKTENTMVDPLYREKLIYPRFESRFKEEYSSKCNVLFSTRGPREAIRQRLAHGYQEVGEWKHLLLSARRSLLGSKEKFLGSALDSRYFDLLPLHSSVLNNVPLQFFWQKAKGNYPLTASRFPEDIQWRFVDNPYHDYLLGVLWKSEEKAEISGYSVIRNPSKNRILPMIEDIVVENPCAGDFSALLQVSLRSLFLKGFYWSSLPFVVDRSKASRELLAGAARFVSRGANAMSVVKHMLHDQGAVARTAGMMRWVNPNNRVEVSIDEWYVTGMVLEGR